MNVAVFLIIGICLGAAESKGSFSGLEDALTKRQSGGTCAQEDINMALSGLDQECREKSDVLMKMLAQVLNSTLATGRLPGQDLIDDRNRAAEIVCQDSCAGVVYTFFSGCDPSADIVQRAPFLCSANGDIVCRLAEDSEADFTSAECSLEWLTSTNRSICPPGCTEALTTVIQEIGCCISNNIGVFYTVFNATLEDFYSTCGVVNPGLCPVVFQDQDDGVTATAATMWPLLAAIMSATLSMI